MLGNVLRQARLSAGISQKTIAEILNIDRPTYNKIEQNRIAPKYEDLPKLSKALKIDLKILQKSMCAHQKTRCAHPTKSKSSIDTYKLTVELNRANFSKLTKNNLKRCGYNNLREFLSVAYTQLEKQLAELEKTGGTANGKQKEN